MGHVFLNPMVLPHSLQDKFTDASFLKGVLAGTYGQSNREYHNIDHIDDMLGFANFYRDHIKNVDEFAVATLFHDTVYEVHRKDNEERSADLACRVGPWCIRDVDFDIVRRLIMATKHDGKMNPVHNTYDELLMADIDLWSFAAPYDVFKMLGDDVAKEYTAVFPAEQYRVGRKAFFQGMLDRPRIYYTSEFDEAVARRNIQQAMAELG